MAHISGMHIQNQIKRTLSEPDSIEYIRDLLENNEIEHRTELAKRACKKFTFFDTRGFTQLVTEPTHFYPTGSSCIDLIFTNASQCFKSVE